jgi:hypothetical protein
MINRLLTPLTHTTPINYNDMLRIFLRVTYQAKQAALKGTLIRQILSQGKGVSS